MKDIKVIVAMHKPYQASEDPLYYPLHVGATEKESIGYIGDDSGDNISEKNPYYCELTGLYWAMHNLDFDYIGLCHYRRYFSLKHSVKNKLDSVLTLQEASQLLEHSDIILPKKRHYYIESIYEHYKNTMYVEPLDITGDIIREKYPEYYPAFQDLHKRTSAHLFNMFIMKKEIAANYCDWLFSILDELENRTDYTQYDAFHARYFGRISERLMDVYIQTNHLEYKEIRVTDLGDTNWRKKILGFLSATLFKKKYKQSF